ncbi:MAG: O-antigen ligase family protein [Clostridia bacterium]|nr:O-antigen ligase family protein [Clostridia bacterium]
MNNKKKKTLRKGSGVLHLLDRFSEYLYKKASTSFVGHFFASSKEESRKAKRKKLTDPTFIGTVKRRFRPIRKTLSKWIESSILAEALRRFAAGLSETRMKVYGWFFFSFGFYTAALSVFKHFTNIEKLTSLGELYCPLSVVLISLPMLFSRDSLVGAMRRNRITRFLLTDVIGLRDSQFEKLTAKRGKSNIAFILGILLGFLSLIISPEYILLLLLCAAVMYLIFTIPEVGVTLIFFFLPFSRTLLLGITVLYTAFCYFIKLIRGKRTLAFRTEDKFIAVFMGLILFGGLVSVNPDGSLPSALMMICLMLGYFITVNLINTAELLKRITGAVVSSAVIVSIIGICQYFLGETSQIWQDMNMFADISGRVTSTFGNPNILAEYIIMVFPVAAAFFFSSQGGRGRFNSFLGCIALFSCLILTWSRGGWLGLIIGMLIFFIFMTRKTVTFLFFAGISLPFLPLVIPDSVWNRFTSIGNLADSSTSYRVHIWEASLNMLRDCFGSGIGIGEAAFSEVYPLYAYAGVENAPHSHNLFLQISLELGIIGITVFTVIMLIFMKNCISRAINTYERRTRLLILGGMCGILSVLAQGMTDHVWYNYRIFLMFWLMIGLVSAYRRVGLAQKDDSVFRHSEGSVAQVDLT